MVVTQPQNRYIRGFDSDRESLGKDALLADDIDDVDEPDDEGNGDEGDGDAAGEGLIGRASCRERV